MFHVFIPTILPLEYPVAEPALALLRRLAPLMPAALRDVAEVLLKGVAFFGGRLVSVVRLIPGCVHAAEMLDEEVFAVEILDLKVVCVGAVGCAVAGGTDAFGVVDGGGSLVHVAIAYIAPVESQLEVLGGDVSFPLVLRAEGAGASIVGEAADELPSTGDDYFVCFNGCRSRLPAAK